MVLKFKTQIRGMGQLAHGFKISAVLLVAACSSNNLEEAPRGTGDTARTTPQELPAALRRAAYEAPDYGTSDVPPSMLPAAPEIRRETVPAPSRNGQIYVDPTTIPVPSQQASNAYTPQVDLADLDPQVTTPGRAPRAAAAASPAPASAPTVLTYDTPPPPAPATASSVSAEPSRVQTASVMQTAVPTPPMQGTYGLHLASYRNPANVQRGWDELQGMHSGMFRGLQARGQSVNIPGKGQYVRLIVGPFRSPDDARRLCLELKSLDEYCKVMPFDGRPVS